MFLTHVSIALLCSSLYFSLPLSTSLFLSLLPDFAAFSLSLLSLEIAVPNASYIARDALIPMQFVSSFSHSIGGTVILALLYLIISRLFTRKSRTGPTWRLTLTLALSHIFLDILVHPHQNIQLLPFTMKYPLALGLWLHFGRLFHSILEIIGLWVSLLIYANRTELIRLKPNAVWYRRFHWGLFIYGIVLSIMQLGMALRPLESLLDEPQTPKTALIVSLLSFVLIQQWGGYLGRQRERSFAFAGPDHED